MPADILPKTQEVRMKSPVKGILNSSIIRRIGYAQALTISAGGFSTWAWEKVHDTVVNHPEKIGDLVLWVKALPLPPQIAVPVVTLLAVISGGLAQWDRYRKPDIEPQLLVPGAPNNESTTEHYGPER